MENQPFDMNAAGAPMPAPAQSSHAAVYAVVVLVVAALALGAWYFLANSPAPSAVESQAVLPPLSSGTAPADIANDLNQIPDGSSALTQDQNSLGQSIQNL